MHGLGTGGSHEKRNLPAVSKFIILQIKIVVFPLLVSDIKYQVGLIRRFRDDFPMSN